MKHYQIPELQAKLKAARALASCPSTTPHEREAARRTASRIEALLKAREGEKPSGPSVFNDEGSAPRPRPRTNPFAHGYGVPTFEQVIRKMRTQRENPAYRKAY